MIRLTNARLRAWVSDRIIMHKEQYNEVNINVIVNSLIFFCQIYRLLKPDLTSLLNC